MIKLIIIKLIIIKLIVIKLIMLIIIKLIVIKLIMIKLIMIKLIMILPEAQRPGHCLLLHGRHCSLGNAFSAARRPRGHFCEVRRQTDERVAVQGAPTSPLSNAT